MNLWDAMERVLMVSTCSKPTAARVYVSQQMKHAPRGAKARRSTSSNCRGPHYSREWEERDAAWHVKKATRGQDTGPVASVCFLLISGPVGLHVQLTAGLRRRPPAATAVTAQRRFICSPGARHQREDPPAGSADVTWADLTSLQRKPFPQLPLQLREEGQRSARVH